jgi:hypothetical protein
MLRAVGLALLATLPATQDQAAAGPSRGGSLHAAWLHDQLHADPVHTVAAYRAVAADDSLPREERLVALARLLPLAALREDPADARWARAQASAMLGGAGEASVDETLRRLAETAAALRAVLRATPGAPDLERLRAEYERTRGPQPAGPYLRGTAWGGADNLPEVQRRMLRAAEERGDGAESARLRRLIAASAGELEVRSARARQIRRWARDAVESELAGQIDKAARLRRNLTAMRAGGRAPALLAERFARNPDRMIRGSLERLPAALANPRGDEPFTEREKDVAQRALAEASRRYDAGDRAGASALLWPTAVLLRSME